MGQCHALVVEKKDQHLLWMRMRVRMELKEQCKALVGEKMGQHSAPARDTALGQVRFKGTV